MKIFRYKLILLILVIIGCTKEAEKPVFDVLLIGSSYTATYNSYLDSIVFANGDSIHMTTSSMGNGTIKRHLNEGNTLALITENHFDYIMIQEAAFMAALTPEELQEGTAPYLKQLIDTIRYYSPDTRIGLYMTHAYKNGNTDRCAVDSVVCNYEGMQGRIIENTTQLAGQFNLELAPVGTYWQLFHKNYPEIQIWSGDNSHPLMYGNYLTASIIYSTIYQQADASEYYPPKSDSLIVQNIRSFLNASLIE